MKDDLNNIIGWALIGTSHGMQTNCGGCISGFDIRTITDLDNRKIEVFPGSEILCLYRELRNNLLINYYILYQYAREMDLDRPGTFYGSVLVSVKYSVDGHKAYELLKELASKLSTYLDSNSRFTVNLASIPLYQPPSLASIDKYLRLEETSLIPGSNQAFIGLKNPSEALAADFFKQAIKPELTRKFNRIYGSYHKGVSEAVQKRRTLKVLDPLMIDLELKIEDLNTYSSQMKVELQEKGLEAKNNELNFLEKIATLEKRVKHYKVENERLNLALLHKLPQETAQYAGVVESTVGGKKLKNTIRRRPTISEYEAPDPEAEFVLDRLVDSGDGYMPEAKHPEDHWLHRAGLKTTSSFSFKRFWRKNRIYLIAGLASLFLLGFFLFNEDPDLFSDPTDDVTSAASVETDRFRSQSFKPVPIGFAAQSALEQHIRKEAIEFYRSAHEKGNLYSPGELSKRMVDYKQNGLKLDSTYKLLEELNRNYCLTGLPFSKLKTFTYKIQKGDKSLGAILTKLKKLHMDERTPPWFETSLKARNKQSVSKSFHIGDSLVYMLPK